MISLFSGEDTYESYIAAGTFAQKKSKELNLPIKVLNADDISSPEEFSIEVESVDMFSSGSVIIAKRLLSNKSLVEYIQNQFDHLQQFEIIIWQDGKVDKRLSSIKTIQKKGSFQDFTLLKEWQLAKWLEEQAKKRSVSLSKTQIERTVQLVGIDKWLLINELKKIALFLEAKKKTSVTDEELENILGANVRGDMWKFLDAFAFKQTRTALDELQKLSQYDDVSQYVISMLEREINLMTKIKIAEQTNGDYKSLGLHPFVLQQTIKKSSGHQLNELQEKQYALFELDLGIKTGRVNPQTGVIMYIIESTNQS